jgi:hypothetical protein
MVRQVYQDSLPPDADVWVKGARDLNQILPQLQRFGQLGYFLLRLSQNEKNTIRISELFKKTCRKNY